MQELARRIYKATESPAAGNSNSNFNHSPKRKCSSSPQNHGKETGLLGVTCMI